MFSHLFTYSSKSSPVDGRSISRNSGLLGWMLSTNIFKDPVAIYQVLETPANEVGEFKPFIISGTEPFSWRVSSGSLPEGWELNSATGGIVYDTAGMAGDGRCVITVSNPAGVREVTLLWNIRELYGRNSYLNISNPYPLFSRYKNNRLTTGVFLKLPGTGSFDNGLFTADTAYSIYYLDTADGKATYLMYDTGQNRYYYFNDKTTLPRDLISGAMTDLVLDGAENSMSTLLTYKGITHPLNIDSIKYGTQLRYLSVDSDSSLDNFLSADNIWSFGFRLDEDIPLDGLKRSLFSRRYGNFVTLGNSYEGKNNSYIVGSNAKEFILYYKKFTMLRAGDFMKFTMSPSGFKIYKNSVRLDRNPSLSLMFQPGSEQLNNSDLSFGVVADSNVAKYNSQYFHGNWQGLISRLWIANGAEVTENDDGTDYPTPTTHAWSLNETTGNDFAPTIGDVNIKGMIFNG